MWWNPACVSDHAVGHSDEQADCHCCEGDFEVDAERGKHADEDVSAELVCPEQGRTSLRREIALAVRASGWSMTSGPPYSGGEGVGKSDFRSF